MEALNVLADFFEYIAYVLCVVVFVVGVFLFWPNTINKVFGFFDRSYDYEKNREKR